VQAGRQQVRRLDERQVQGHTLSLSETMSLHRQ
jgi:hypothetical protein